MVKSNPPNNSLELELQINKSTAEIETLNKKLKDYEPDLNQYPQPSQLIRIEKNLKASLELVNERKQSIIGDRITLEIPTEFHELNWVANGTFNTNQMNFERNYTNVLTIATANNNNNNYEPYFTANVTDAVNTTGTINKNLEVPYFIGTSTTAISAVENNKSISNNINNGNCDAGLDQPNNLPNEAKKGDGASSTTGNLLNDPCDLDDLNWDIEVNLDDLDNLLG
ncbi:hypothetical protein Patl1_27331 [Pistacia atlantica]|uniref:Uncharacterized protein n=1 Tax=Pistacia atlantica TaxID=434234 RepID=A0ACC1BGD9_9ROSI|nr:hypothetical protein Patl1_27331 [Pistacia atlantica]